VVVVDLDVDSAGNDRQVAESTRRPPAASTSRPWCLRKSTPRIGKETAASRKFQLNFRPPMLTACSLVPQQGMLLPPADRKRGPSGRFVEV